jgi:WD40 repeat protein
MSRIFTFLWPLALFTVLLGAFVEEVPNRGASQAPAKEEPLAVSDTVYCLTFSRDGSLLVCGTLDGSLHLLDIRNRRVKKTLRKHEGAVSGIAFSADGKTLASAGSDKRVVFWNAADWSVISTAKTAFPVNCLAFSADAKFIAIGEDHDKMNLQISRIENHKQPLPLIGHTDAVGAVAFSPTAHLLASASADASIKLWELPEGRCVATFAGHKKSVCSVAFSPDGRTLASASFDGTLKLWDVRTRTNTLTLKGHLWPLCFVVFCPIPDLIASCDFGGTIKVWSLTNRRCIFSMKASPRPIQCLCFDRLGTILAAGEGEPWRGIVHLLCFKDILGRP